MRLPFFDTRLLIVPIFVGPWNRIFVKKLSLQDFQFEEQFEIGRVRMSHQNIKTMRTYDEDRTRVIGAKDNGRTKE